MQTIVTMATPLQPGVKLRVERDEVNKILKQTSKNSEAIHATSSASPCYAFWHQQKISTPLLAIDTKLPKLVFQRHVASNSFL